MAEAENIMVWQWQRLAEAEVKKPHVNIPQCNGSKGNDQTKKTI